MLDKIMTGLQYAFEQSKLQRCLNVLSPTGHDFGKTVIGTGNAIIIVHTCFYCGKTFEHKVAVDQAAMFAAMQSISQQPS